MKPWTYLFKQSKQAATIFMNREHQSDLESESEKIPAVTTRWRRFSFYTTKTRLTAHVTKPQLETL